MIITLNLLTFFSVLTCLIFIGKFFCVKIAEKIYDSWENEMSLWVPIFWTVSNVFLIPAWIGATKEIFPLFLFSAMFSAGFCFMYVAFELIVVLNAVLVPALKNVHVKIKLKKSQGKL